MKIKTLSLKGPLIIYPKVNKIFDLFAFVFSTDLEQTY